MPVFVYILCCCLARDMEFFLSPFSDLRFSPGQEFASLLAGGMNTIGSDRNDTGIKVITHILLIISGKKEVF